MATRNATLRINGGNEISNTSDSGGVMDLTQGTAVRESPRGDNGPDTITAGASGVAIAVDRQSNADFRGIVSTGRIQLGRLGLLLLRDSTSNGNITVNETTVLSFGRNVTVNGDVFECGGVIFGVPEFGAGFDFALCP